MFEEPPFRLCPACFSKDGLGILSIGGSNLTRRCKLCRHTVREPLPPVDKAVIYLDQFAISNIYKVATGTLRQTATNRPFWTRLHDAVMRAYRLQQAIFPASDIHYNETVVATDIADGLSPAHEMLSGDTRFKRVEDIVCAQAWAFAEAYADGNPPPKLDFSVDNILAGERNAWIPRLHITTNMSFRQFAPGIRAGREAASRSFQALAAKWASEKPRFSAVLNNELNSLGGANRAALLAWKEGAYCRVLRQILGLLAIFERRGMSQSQATVEVVKFWDWKGNHHQPEHRISSYLFAGLARRIGSGQRPPDRGTLNDVRAIATYGPYVDAMFIDKMFEVLLGEQPLANDLAMKAQFYSVRNGDAFIAYLDGLCARATDKVREYAEEVYGVT